MPRKIAEFSAVEALDKGGFFWPSIVIVLELERVRNKVSVIIGVS